MRACFQYCLVFLFKDWVIDSQGKMTSAVIACILLGICNALFVLLRQFLVRKARKRLAKPGVKDVSSFSPAVVAENISFFVLYFCQYSLSYLLMLLAMSCYLGFFLAVVFGKSHETHDGQFLCFIIPFFDCCLMLLGLSVGQLLLRHLNTGEGVDESLDACCVQDGDGVAVRSRPGMPRYRQYD